MKTTFLDFKCTEAVAEPGERQACDDRDNDCDGTIDEGLTNACGTCGVLPPEACNGLDDNCDGRVDEDAPCPEGSACVAGACVVSCRAGECPVGKTSIHAGTIGEICHPRPCALVICASGQTGDAGRCVDPCNDVTCPNEQICDFGDCLSVMPTGVRTGLSLHLGNVRARSMCSSAMRR